MLEFWRELTAASVPALLCQPGRLRPETSSLFKQEPVYGLSAVVEVWLYLFLQEVIVCIAHISLTNKTHSHQRLNH